MKNEKISYLKELLALVLSEIPERPLVGPQGCRLFPYLLQQVGPREMEPLQGYSTEILTCSSRLARVKWNLYTDSRLRFLHAPAGLHA